MMGFRETSREIMKRDRQVSAKPHAPKTHIFLSLDFQNLPSNPDSPSGPQWPPSSSGPPPLPQTPQILAVNFLGATLADTASFPPDSMGAAGPSQFIVALNGRIRSFNKFTGVADGGINANPDVFFTSVMTPPVNNNFTSDPRIRYDRLSGRWFITIIDVPGFSGTQPNRVLLAVSDSGTITPSTVWTFFYFQADNSKFGDYPTLGIDANALYLGVNLFSSRGLKTSFGGTTAFVVRKSSVLGPGPIVVTTFAGLVGKQQGHFTGPYSPQGADNYDPAANEGYIIGVDAGLYGELQLRRVANPGGTPSISSDITITIPLNGGTINVPHLGNAGGANGYLDGGDYRLLAAHVRNGHLWTTANIGVDNTGTPGGTDTRMGVRWYDLTGIASGQTPTVNQSGTVYQPSASNTTDQRSYWMGTLMVSGQGNAAMGFSVAGANERANAGTVGRLANDPLGTMRTPVLYTASTTAYNPSGDPGSSNGRRWGDYSYTSLDPSDDMTMWTIQQFCNAADSYGVQVVKLLAPPPAMLSTCSPSTLTNGTANVSIQLAGTSNGDTGFFDPGPGFSNRISASVSGGGVTVNSITYNDPTHLTLNLSVAANATGGARTVSVSNPDGQAVTSASPILNIIGATNHPPVLTAQSDRTVHAGSTLYVTNSATDPDDPPNTLTYSLGASSPATATINPATGLFTWTPDDSFVNTTNPATVQVTDNGSPPLSDSKSFNILVVARPSIQSIGHTNNIVTMTWSTIAGQTYRLQYKVNLNDAVWMDLVPDLTASGSVVSATDPTAISSSRFYRIQLVR
jgi:hypothetical protein